MKFFQYDKVSGNIAVDDPSILLIRELVALVNPTRNKTTSDKTGKKLTKAFKEFTYIYLFFDWESPYFAVPEETRHIEALADSGLTDKEYDDAVFREACRKYDELQNSSLDIKMLKAAMSAVDKQIYYLQTVDLMERDPVSGKPIFKSKDLIAEIKGCKDLISSLRELEDQVKKGLSPESNVRGGTKLGFFDGE